MSANELLKAFEVVTGISTEKFLLELYDSFQPKETRKKLFKRRMYRRHYKNRKGGDK